MGQTFARVRCYFAGLAFLLLGPAIAAAQVPVTVLHQFAPDGPSNPTHLVAASDGSLYGFDNLRVFRVTGAGDLTVIRTLSSAQCCVKGLIEANGILYGAIQSLSAVDDALFSMNVDGTGFTVLHRFVNSEGREPRDLVRTADGAIFGLLTTLDSAHHPGIFKYDPTSGTLSLAHTFSGSEGLAGSDEQNTSLTLASDGNLYGAIVLRTIDSGGRAVGAEIFRLSPAGDFAIVRAFDCAVETLCATDYVVEGNDGFLYARARTALQTTTAAAILRIARSGGSASTVIDGLSLWKRFVQGADGNFYSFRSDGSGVAIVKLTTAGVQSVVHAFPAGAYVDGALAAATDGNVFGVTTGDGVQKRGTLVRIGMDGSYAVLLSFAAGLEGRDAIHIVRGSDGALYGTARQGGVFDLGTVFRAGLDGSFSVLHSFAGADAGDGAYPLGLVQASDGNLYGTTAEGGTGNLGTLFRITPQGALTVLAVRRWINVPTQASDGFLYALASSLPNFLRSSLDGAITGLGGLPNASYLMPNPLVEHPNGSLYGSTPGNGDPRYNLKGGIFAVSPAGTVSLVYTFIDGTTPNGALVVARDGAIFGTGTSSIFRYVPGTAGGPLSIYTSATRTFFPAFVQASDGDFYGYASPAAGAAEVFRVTSAGAYSTLYAFPSAATLPDDLLQLPDGRFAGTSHDTGAPSVIFTFDMPQVMTLDVPGDGATVPQPFYAGGWAIDRALVAGSGVDAVHVWAYPSDGTAARFIGAAEVGRARPDIAAIFGDRYGNSGYRITVDGLPPGIYRLTAYAHSIGTNTFNQLRSVTVTIHAAPRVSQPAMWIDAPSGTVATPFTVAGWAADLGSMEGAGVDAVHVYVIDPSNVSTFLGVAAYGSARPDVGAALGPSFTSAGYTLPVTTLAPGVYTLVVYAHSTFSGTWFWQTRAITVRTPGRPAMAIDTPPDHAVTGQPFPVAGWALDLDALESQGNGIDAVHVWAIDSHGAGTFVGATTTGDQRPDLGTAFGGQFATAGYHLMANGLAPGDYTLVVYAHSAVANTWTWQTRAITVRPGRPVMALDTPTDQSTTGQPFLVAGWAIDLDATSGPGVDVVHVWAIDGTGAGTFVGATTTGGQRNDVGAAFGSQFATSGYNLMGSGLAPGTYQLIVYAHSTVTNSFSQARVVTVTVQ